MCDTGWQPIETAPMNGTDFLCWARWNWDCYDPDCDKQYETRIASYTGYAFRYENSGEAYPCISSTTSNPYTDYAVEPTHWMPLPKSPEVKDDD